MVVSGWKRLSQARAAVLNFAKSRIKDQYCYLLVVYVVETQSLRF